MRQWNNKYSQETWDDFYSNERKNHIKIKENSIFSSYDIFLCDNIFDKYFPRSDNWNKLKIVEIWSWDWKMLKKISDKYWYNATGLEYSQAWVKMWLANWVNTILCDVFDEEQISPFFEKFDIVYSYWFIEHIIPVEKAIEQHIKLLKKWWTLIMQIPRIKWFNYKKIKLLRPDLIPLHNLDLMEDFILSKHCKNFKELQEIYCKNYWTFKIRVPTSKEIMWNFKYYIAKFLSYFEYISNPLLRLLFWKKGHESKYFSPCIIYIWKKI